MSREDKIEEILHKAHENGVFNSLVDQIRKDYPNQQIDPEIWEKYFDKVSSKSYQEPL